MTGRLRGALKGAVGPRANDSRFLLDVHRRDLPGQDTMAHYAESDEVDLVIVGAGAGGSVLAQRLARRGWRIVIIEAGPFWHPDEDWVSDEAGSHELYWTQERVIGGQDPIEMGKNNSGRGVGGSMVHYAGYCPRFHPSDFETYTRDGVGADWPISYPDLKVHYEELERELPVAGQDWPWGDPHRYPFSPHRSARRRRSCGAAPSSRTSTCAWDRWESSTARLATARTASIAASACRAARSTPRPVPT